MTTTIYCFIVGHWRRGEDVYVLAVDEDGKTLAQHISSNPEWAQHDIGITSNWKHDRFTLSYTQTVMNFSGSPRQKVPVN
jgi:hypothetical protein